MTLNLKLSEVQIRQVQSPEGAIAVLRCLKNEIVGDIQAKETWVEQGALELVSRTLSHTQHDFAHTPASAPGLAEDGLARLQALQVLASFAKGGSSFFSPIHAAGLIPATLSSIHPLENHPRIVLAALRVLSSLAVATRLSASTSEDETLLADAVFSPTQLDSFYAILNSESSSSTCVEQKSLVTGLLARLCRDPRHQNALANAGILDALGTMLAGFVVARGEVVPGAEEQSNGMAESIPGAAPRGAVLSDTLSAISAIIEDSRFRSCMLLCSPAIMAVFPGLGFTPPTQECHLVWNTLESAGLRSLETKSSTGAMEYLLPAVPDYQSKSPRSTFSRGALMGRPVSRENPRPTSSLWDQLSRDAQTSNSEVHEEPESPMIPWLINLVRSTTGLDRVLAASVLASLVSAGFASSERETTIGRVVVPILCQIMRDHGKAENPNSPSCLKSSVASDWAIIERTPAVLARLIADSEYLQQAAYDSGAAKMACALLKQSFEPLEMPAPKPWSSDPERRREVGEGLASHRIGPAGRMPTSAHRIQLRENSLLLIASMLSFKDEFRKAVVEYELMPYLAECLVEVPSKPKPAKDRPKVEKGAAIEEMAAIKEEDSPYGNNPKSVIIAACHVIRSLGRSVSVTRVHLEDYGVSTAIFHLLKDADVSLQVAACAAVCNLVLEVSPMRAPLIKAGVLGILCDHAHSPNPGLRLNAMWALKHMLLGAKNDMKRQMLGQLGGGWLLQLITVDMEDDALHNRMRRRDDVANPDKEDEEMDSDAYVDDGSWVWPGMAHFQSPPVRVQQAYKKLIALREAEMSALKKARSDDLAIQEQGLNFIRNLLGMPEGNNGGNLDEMADMLDHVLSELGQDRLFDVLAQKLRFKVLRPFDRRRLAPSRSAGSSVNDSRVVYPQAKVVEAVVYILVHMAASIPRHRQLVITQTDLLKQLGGHFTSKDAEVRKALCHLMNNLAWQDNGDDANECATRTQELRRLGFLAKLEVLEQSDHELDVRERARMAVNLLKTKPTA